jgi:hypothetical protein
MRDLPGFGDEATWPPFSGHPNDPRHPGYDDEEEEGAKGMKITIVIEIPDIADPNSPEADAIIEEVTDWTEEVREERGWNIYVDDAE